MDFTYNVRFSKLVSKSCVNDCSLSMAFIQMEEATTPFLLLFKCNVLTL